jgi:hypothetical protein
MIRDSLNAAAASRRTNVPIGLAQISRNFVISGAFFLGRLFIAVTLFPMGEAVTNQWQVTAASYQSVFNILPTPAFEVPDPIRPIDLEEVFSAGLTQIGQSLAYVG